MNNNLNSIYPLSYDTFLNDIQRFKKAGGPNSDSFNFFDSPSHKYYKIFFYFGTKSEFNAYNVSSEYSGLLAPSWIYASKHVKELSDSKYYINNYFVNEPTPTSEPYNIDVYNDRIINAFEDFKKINSKYLTFGTDFEYLMNVLDDNRMEYSGSGLKNFTGTYKLFKDSLFGEKKFYRLYFENGMLKSSEVLDTSNETSNTVYNDFIQHVKQREEVKQNRISAYDSLRYAYNDRNNYINKYYEYLLDLNVHNFNSRNFSASTGYLFNTAHAYLCLQGYYNRASQLRKFIELLSNISIESPWYFSSVAGISEALNRKCVDGAKMDLSIRPKITIKCLPDAFDNRIGTLLDLYRSVVFDWKNKKEIIPANLRKFDMAIYIFEAPDQRWHKEEKGDLTKIADKWTEAYNDTIGNTLKSIFPNASNNIKKGNYNKGSASLIAEDGNSNFLASHKIIEFHDCEINYNTGTSAWSLLDNKTGFTPEYNIEISFGDCYEISYNDLFQQYYGDSSIIVSRNSEFYNNQRELLNKRIENSDGWLKQFGIGLLNRLNDKGIGLVKNLAFGNLYGFSLTDTLNQISNGIQNPMMAFDTVMGYAKNGKEMVNQSKKQAKGIANTMVNTAKNTIGYNEFSNEYASNKDLSNGYNISNPATMQIPSDTQVKQQNNNNSNNYVKYVQQQLNSDNNIADNNILPITKTQFSGGSLFEAYTKSKGIKSSKVNDNIFKSSTIANNI